MLLCVSKDVEQQLVQPIINSSFDYILLQKGTPWHENVLTWFSLIKRKLSIPGTERIIKPKERDMVKSAVVGFVNLIWNELAENITPDDKPQPECSQLSSMKSMIAYIDAAAGFVSKRTCGNMFERFLYTPPMKYLNEYRLKKSIELLRGTDMTITEIALACGFSGASYFAESFRRELGKSPGEYRKDIENDDLEQAVLSFCGVRR